MYNKNIKGGLIFTIHYALQLGKEQHYVQERFVPVLHKPGKHATFNHSKKTHRGELLPNSKTPTCTEDTCICTAAWV